MGNEDLHEGIETPGGHPPPNRWDAITWLFKDLLPTAYEPVMAETVSVHDFVAVTPKPQGGDRAGREQDLSPVCVGVVTEVNFAEQGTQNQADGSWTLKVRDLRPDNSTVESEYSTDRYDFYLLEEEQGGAQD